MFIFLIVNPADHRDKVGDEAGNVTFDEDVVPPDNVRLVYVSFVILSYNWKECQRIGCFNCLFMNLTALCDFFVGNRWRSLFSECRSIQKK